MRQLRFQLWHGPETGEIHHINYFTMEGDAKRNGEFLAQMLPRTEHVFVTCLEPEEVSDEDLYTLEYSVVTGEWSDAVLNDGDEHYSKVDPKAEQEEEP